MATYIEPIEHPRAQEARQKGMTVELLLALEKAQANALKNLGVIIEDYKDAYLNQLAAIKNNPQELQRQKEGEAKAKENAAKAFNGVLAMGMLSTYHDLFNLDNLLSSGQALALDLGSAVLLGGAGLAKLAIGRRAAQNAFENKVAREIAEKSAAKTAEKNTTILTASNKPATTSLAFFERPKAKLTEAERLGIPKGGQERFIKNNESEILQNAKTFAEKYGYDIPETIDAAKEMYKQHNRWFRTVGSLRFLDNSEFGWAKFAPELQGRSEEEVAKILASRGYPEYSRTWDPSSIGKYSDETVFASPSMAENAVYLGSEGTTTVLLQRPFSLRNPLQWHIDADYVPISKYDRITKVGQTQIGNAGPKYEIKLGTKHLIPVKIAEQTDKGTLLGDFLGNVTYKSGGKLNYLKFFK